MVTEVVVLVTNASVDMTDSILEKMYFGVNENKSKVLSKVY